MQYEKAKSGSPIHPLGSPLRPFDHDARSVAAQRVCSAIQKAGGPVALQLSVGNMVYMGEASQEIEAALIAGGAAREQADAILAVMPTTRRPILVMHPWWPLGTMDYYQLDRLYRAQNHARVVQGQLL